MSELNERQEAALTFLLERTSAPIEGSDPWVVPADNIYAYQLADHLLSIGLMESKSNQSNAYKRERAAAANTLVALKRRGFADNDGGAAFERGAKWWITRSGQLHARQP